MCFRYNIQVRCFYNIFYGFIVLSKLLTCIRWGGNQTEPALKIDPNIRLPQFELTDHRLVEREFNLSTGIIELYVSTLQ